MDRVRTSRKHKVKETRKTTGENAGWRSLEVHNYWTAHLLILVLLLLSFWQHLNHAKLNSIKMTTKKEEVCKRRIVVESNVVTRNYYASQNAQPRWNRTNILLNWYRGFFLLWSGDKTYHSSASSAVKKNEGSWVSLSLSPCLCAGTLCPFSVVFILVAALNLVPTELLARI